MGTIADKLNKALANKADIKAALIEKNRTPNDNMSTWGDEIRAIETDGGGAVGAGDDRISLMKPDQGEWSEIILTEDVETGYKVRYANFFPEEGKNLSTAYLLVMNSAEYVIENGIAETAFWTFSIIPNKIFDNGDLTAYAGAYATTFTPKTTESGEYYDISLYTYPDFMFYYGEEQEAFAWGATVYSQPPQEVNTQHGYYINRVDVKFGSGDNDILLTDLDKITYRVNGLAYNGRIAWVGEAENSSNRYAELIDDNDNVICDLIIYDGKNWDNDVYSASQLGEGWVDAADGSVIILFTDSGNGGDLNKLFDFYFEQRKTASDTTRYELHTPRVVNYNDGLNTYAVTQYSNKGYLLGLPASDATEELNSDTHIVGTVEIYNPTGSTTRIKAEFTYPSGKPYVQAIIPRTYGYLYVRLYDNFVTSPHEVEYAVDYVEFTAAAGKSTVIAFLYETDSYADDVVYLEDLEDFISYKNKIAVIINIPSQTNVINSQLGEKTITENGTYAAVDDDVKGYSAVTVNVQPDDTLYADVEATLPSDYVAAGTKYRFVSSIGEVFLSFNVASSNIYKLNKTTREFDIIGSIANVFPQKWYELPDGTVLCAYTGTPARTVLAYNPLTNLLEDFTRLSEYFLADGIETDFTFKLASGTYSNLRVYLDEVLLTETQEDGVDEHTGDGTVLYLLNRTPSVASPVTTDFVVKVNGNIVPNPGNTNYSYIWQVGAQRHSIVFPTGNQYIPESGDTVEIIYDMKNYTSGNYFINFDVVPEEGVEIVILYDTTIPSTAFNPIDVNGVCVATSDYGGIYRFEAVHNTFELLSTTIIPYRLHNKYGDVIFSTTTNSNVATLRHGAHSIVFYSSLITAFYTHEGYDGEMFLVPSASNASQGVYRFDHSDGSLTQILTSIPGGGDYNKALILEPVTNDVFIGSQSNYITNLGCIRYNRATGVASITNGSQNKGQEAKRYNGFNYVVGYNISLYSYWDRTTETWVSMFSGSSRTLQNWTNGIGTALLNVYAGTLYAYDTTTGTNTSIHAKTCDGFNELNGDLYYYSYPTNAPGTFVLRNHSLTPVKIADINISFYTLAPDSYIYGAVNSTAQVVRYNPSDDSVVLLDGYPRTGAAWLFYNGKIYTYSTSSVSGVYECAETAVELIQEWFGGVYLHKDLCYLSVTACYAIFSFTKKRVFASAMTLVDSETQSTIFIDGQQKILIFNKEVI